MARKIVLYGGSFNPLHSAHLEIIDYLSKHYDLVVIIPTNVTYYKDADPMFSFEERYKAIKDKISVFNNVVISTVEKNIPKTWRFIDTLKYMVKYHVLYKDEDIDKISEDIKNVDTQIYLAIGSDSLLTFKTWYAWQDILKLAKLVVFNRPGYTENLPRDIEYEYIPMNNPESSTRLRKLILQKK